jgi:ubiquinone/menaquinone biosynthesis C-methylase UbiE
MLNPENHSLQKKYNITAYFYDVIDYPWERHYRQWRRVLCNDIQGDVLELGVGTGRNIPFYSEHVNLTGIDLSPRMLKTAMKRAAKARCRIQELKHEDATTLNSLSSSQYDWLISSFMLCVMPDEMQKLAITQFQRVLKPGGHFRILDLSYSKNFFARLRQKTFSKCVEKIYGARCDRSTLENLTQAPHLKIDSVRYVHHDILRIIAGRRI